MPRKDWSSPRLVGNGYSWIALHFVESALKSSLKITWPKYSSSRRLNAHFFILACKPAVPITIEPSKGLVHMQQQTMRRWEYHLDTRCKRYPDWLKVSYAWAFRMLQVPYTIWMEEHDTQRVQSTLEMQFYAHDPWLSELDGSLGLSQSC